MYKGYKMVRPTADEFQSVYENNGENVFDCNINEYILCEDDNGEIVDRLRWDGEAYKHLTFKPIGNDFTGKIKPRNPQQELAFDLLNNKDITVKVLLGGFGTGKTLLMASAAVQGVKSGKFDKIIWVRNNIEVKNTKSIGALPGTLNEKLSWVAAPLADKLGGSSGLDFAIAQGEVEIQHLGFMRGRDIKNSIILCSEAENLTKEHVQLLLGRVGEGSMLWLEGDVRQSDMGIFETNSGLSTAIERLKGNPLFGYVHLEKCERSETAALADLLD